MAVAGGNSQAWVCAHVARKRHLSKLCVQSDSRKARERLIPLSTLENVHHSNEPHDLGNASESRVDTEVQNYAMHHYFIYCERPNSPSPNHGRDPATIKRVGGVSKERKMFRNFLADGDRITLGQAQNNFALKNSSDAFRIVSTGHAFRGARPTSLSDPI